MKFKIITSKVVKNIYEADADSISVLKEKMLEGTINAKHITTIEEEEDTFTIIPSISSKLDEGE